MPFNLKHTAILIAVSLAALSCEEVIHLDLNEADPRYVIEGTVSDAGGKAIVKVSQTLDFSAPGLFSGISNAQVTLAEGDNPHETLLETEPGIYESALPTGTPGNTYHLRVQIGNKLFTAESTMPQKVRIDSLYFERENFPGQSYLMPFIRYKDLEGTPNYYRYRLFVNDRFIKMVDVDSDEYSDGLIRNRGVFYFGDENNQDTADDEGLQIGDEIALHLYCIDREVYEYFKSLQQTLEQSEASPTNPITNIQGGALGYFSAFTLDIQTRVVTEP